MTDPSLRPRVGLGIVLIPERLELVPMLLDDIAGQTEQPTEVTVVLQRSGPSGADALARSITDDFPRLPVRVIANDGQGVTVARNLILDRSGADVLLFLDDDARLPAHTVAHVADAFVRHPHASVILFRAEWVGEGRTTRYPPAERRLRTRRSVSHVALIEMAVAVRSVARLGVRFDERFGQGTQLPTGEEFILVVDVLRRGGEVRFVPAEIASHAALSAGLRLHEGVMLAKGAMFHRTYGLLGLFVGPAFALRKAMQHQLGTSTTTAVRKVLAGWRDLSRA